MINDHVGSRDIYDLTKNTYMSHGLPYFLYIRNPEISAK